MLRDIRRIAGNPRPRGIRHRRPAYRAGARRRDRQGCPRGRDHVVALHRRRRRAGAQGAGQAESHGREPVGVRRQRHGLLQFSRQHLVLWFRQPASRPRRQRQPDQPVGCGNVGHRRLRGTAAPELCGFHRDRAHRQRRRLPGLRPRPAGDAGRRPVPGNGEEPGRVSCGARQGARQGNTHRCAQGGPYRKVGRACRLAFRRNGGTTWTNWRRR